MLGRVFLFLVLLSVVVVGILWLIDYFYVRRRKLLIGGAEKYHKDEEKIADEEIKSWNEEEKRVNKKMGKRKR